MGFFCWGTMSNIDTEIANAVNACGMQLYGVDRADGVITVYIENNDETVSIADCESVMKQLKYSTDVDHLHIEVSSKGMYPPLFTPEHYKAAMGKSLKVRTQNKSYVGTLIDITPDELKLQKGEHLFEVSLESIRRVKVIPTQKGE